MMSNVRGEFVVAIPIETKVRELRGKLWLGLNLLEDGHTIVLGEEDSIKSGIDIVRPDVYFAGHARFNQDRYGLYRDLQQSSANVVFLDPEGGVFISDEAWKEDRLSDQMLALGAAYFAWGERQAQMIEQDRPQFSGKIVVSGNPRFDLLHEGLREVYRTEAEEIGERYDEFFLFNTNFSIVNHAHADVDSFLANSSAYLQDLDVDYRKDLYRRFVEMTERIARNFGKQMIVIRPHPSESHEPYEDLAESIENIVVEHSGDVRPWILASTAVIHNSCTTGIESAMLATPVFAYRPIASESNDLSLPNVVSEEKTTIKALSRDLKRCISGDYGSYHLNEEQRSALRQYFFNVDEAVAGKRIAETINSFDPRGRISTPLQEPTLLQRLGRVGNRYIGREGLETAMRLVPGNEVAYKRQKFPYLRHEELTHYCDLFDPFLDYDSSEIEIVKLPELPNTFMLSRG